MVPKDINEWNTRRFQDLENLDLSLRVVWLDIRISDDFQSLVT